MRRFDQQPGYRQQTKRQHRLHAAFHLAHAQTHLVHALHRVLHTNGQNHGRQAKAVAQFVGLLNRAQVHRHHGPDFLACNLITERLEVFTNGASHATQQDIVDGTVQGPSDGLHFCQWNRLTPRHPFARTGNAFEAGGGVIGHERQRGTVTNHLVRQPGQFDRTAQTLFDALFNAFFRLAHHPHDAGGPVTRRTECFHRHLRQRLDQRVQNPVLGAVTPLMGRFIDSTLRWRQPTVHQRLRDGNQGNAICNAMVNTHHQGRAPLVMLNQVKLPQRILHVERLHGELTQTVLQCLLLAAF